FRIFEKLGISSRVELVLYALNQGGRSTCSGSPRACESSRLRQRLKPVIQWHSLGTGETQNRSWRGISLHCLDARGAIHQPYNVSQPYRGRGHGPDWDGSRTFANSTAPQRIDAFSAAVVAQYCRHCLYDSGAFPVCVASWSKSRSGDG